MSAILDCFGLTDRGKVRRLNEDQFLIADLTKRIHVRDTSLPRIDESEWSRGVVGHLLVVADGMGGMAGGEIASGLAVEMISWYVTRTMPWFYRYQDGREEELEAELRVAVEACQKGVSDAAAGSRFTKMGTTLTMAYVLWPRVYVVHAGDSRCYLLRNESIHQMTRDHTLAQRAIEAGFLTPEQAVKSPLNHTLWNCIGGATAGVTPDIYRATLERGDHLLLCTDGLTRGVSEEEIGRLVREAETPEAAARALVDAANDAGGDDNTTVVVARVQPRRDPDDTAVMDACDFLPAL
jgi:serine/threonine protein phosphatase PrpC